MRTRARVGDVRADQSEQGSRRLVSATHEGCFRRFLLILEGEEEAGEMKTEARRRRRSHLMIWCRARCERDRVVGLSMCRTDKQRARVIALSLPLAAGSSGRVRVRGRESRPTPPHSIRRSTRRGQARGRRRGRGRGTRALVWSTRTRPTLSPRLTYGQCHAAHCTCTCHAATLPRPCHAASHCHPGEARS